MGFVRNSIVLIIGTLVLSGCFKTEAALKAERIEQAKPEVFYRMLVSRGYTNLVSKISQTQSENEGDVNPSYPTTLDESMLGIVRARVYSEEDIERIQSSIIGQDFYYSRNKKLSTFSTIRFNDDATEIYVEIYSALSDMGILFEVAVFKYENEKWVLDKITNKVYEPGGCRISFRKQLEPLSDSTIGKVYKAIVELLLQHGESPLIIRESLDIVVSRAYSEERLSMFQKKIQEQKITDEDVENFKMKPIISATFIGLDGIEIFTKGESFEPYGDNEYLVFSFPKFTLEKQHATVHVTTVSNEAFKRERYELKLKNGKWVVENSYFEEGLTL